MCVWGVDFVLFSVLLRGSLSASSNCPAWQMDPRSDPLPPFRTQGSDSKGAASALQKTKSKCVLCLRTPRTLIFLTEAPIFTDPPLPYQTLRAPVCSAGREGGRQEAHAVKATSVQVTWAAEVGTPLPSTHAYHLLSRNSARLSTPMKLKA